MKYIFLPHKLQIMPIFYPPSKIKNMKHKARKSKVYQVKAKTPLGVKRKVLIFAPSRKEAEVLISSAFGSEWEITSFKRARVKEAQMLSDDYLNRKGEPIHKSEETMKRDPRIMGD